LKLDEDRSKEGGGLGGVLDQQNGFGPEFLHSFFAQLRLLLVKERHTKSSNTCERERERQREREECNKYDLTDCWLVKGKRKILTPSREKSVINWT